MNLLVQTYVVLFGLAIVNVACAVLYAILTPKQHIFYDRLYSLLSFWLRLSSLIQLGIVVYLMLSKSETIEPLLLQDFLVHGWDFVSVISWMDKAVLLVFMVLHTLILWFAITYMIREFHAAKFFGMLSVAQIGWLFVLLAQTTQFVLIGWELLGLASVILISYYQHRNQVLRNALRVLVVYKIGDFILFSGFLLFERFDLKLLQVIQSQGHTYTAMLNLLLVACLIKSSIFPWIWLPRAMEGPTTSSALFYGGIASHIPIVLLARSWPQKNVSVTLLLFWSVVIVLMSVMSSAIARKNSDTKNALAYASIPHLGLMVLLVLWAKKEWAILYMFAHLLYRTYLFLRAPSQILDHRLGRLGRTVHADFTLPWQKTLPTWARKKLYYLAQRDFGILKASYGIIDHFLSLRYMQLKPRAIQKFSVFCAGFWIAMQTAFHIFGVQNLKILEEVFSMIALCSSIAAFASLRRKSHFAGFLLLSSTLIFDVLEVHMHTELFVTEWLLVAAIVVWGFWVVLDTRNNNPHTSQLFFLPGEDLQVWRPAIWLIVGLSLAGMPGLGTYFLFENLVHALSVSAPHLLLECFFILSLNTILLFYFVSTQFYGRQQYTSSEEQIALNWGNA